MNKTTKERQLAVILYTQLLIDHPPPAHLPPRTLWDQSPTVQDTFLNKAREYIRQVEGATDEMRDANELRERVAKVVGDLGNGSIVGPTEAEFMTDVAFKCAEIMTSHQIQLHLSAEKLMLMYYSGQSVAQAVKMMSDYIINFSDKMEQVRVKRGKTK